MKYSQNDEQRYITEYFGDTKGRFLDIGAYDGRTFSNTLRLAELGWSGLCLEPDPIVFPHLENVHAEHTYVRCVRAAFGPHSGTIKFYTSNGDAISTTNDAHKAKWEAGWKVTYTEIEVPTMTWADIESNFAQPFEFVNLDVEGTNWELLQLLPLSHMSTKLICVEHDSKINEIIAYCASHGLTQKIHQNGENLIIGHESTTPTLKHRGL